MKNKPISRRTFVQTSAAALAAGMTGASLIPEYLRAGQAILPEHPYDDNTVVRIYDPGVFPGTIKQPASADNDYYWRRLDGQKLRSMLEAALLQLTGAGNSVTAWKQILPGLSASSRVAVKVNMNNTDVPRFKDDWMRRLLSSPAMITALAQSLSGAGAAESNLTVFDRSRTFPEDFRNDIKAGVKVLGKGQIQDSNLRIGISDKGDYSFSVPDCVAEADYLISLHLFKNHAGGVTGCHKNLFGLAENVGTFAHNPDWTTHSQQRDIILNPAISSRLKLVISEAVFTSLHGPDFLDLFSKHDFFPDGKMSSLIVSRSPFHHDAVLYDFMNAEKAEHLDRSIGSDRWLHNCSNEHGGHPTWSPAVLGSAKIVEAGGKLPAKELAYDPAVLRFISKGIGSVTD
jgi:uncharacterized protein (DUF362 family)